MAQRGQHSPSAACSQARSRPGTLDRLTAEGALPPDHREALAADEAFGSLERLLRTVELAGHDPVPSTALAGRSLDDARSPAQVLHSRITRSLHGQLVPNVTSAVDLIPREVPTEWQQWLHDRAEAADARRHELGAQVAEQTPRWATESPRPGPR